MYTARLRDKGPHLAHTYDNGVLRYYAVKRFSDRYETMEDSNNDWPLAGRSVRDIGGNFDHHKILIEVDGMGEELYYNSSNGSIKNQHLDVFLPSNRYSSLLKLAGDSDPVPTQPSWLSSLIYGAMPARLSDSVLTAAGATAVSRVIPTNPNVDLSTSLAELVSARKFFSVPGRSGSASGEYLNFQLGISPVVSDVRDTYNTAKEAEKTLAQYERDAGKLIRRRYEFPGETLFSSTTENGVYPAALGAVPTAYTVYPGTRTESVRTRKRTWFSGAFTYYLPQQGWRRKLAQYDRLYGVIPGSETAYDVIPYSFVADYFGNLGNVLHNVDRFAKDGLVMPYGYVMHEQETRVDTRISYHARKGEVWERKALTGSITYTSQRRLRSNPFGFGLNEADLSPRQVSILAALGINRK